LRSRPGTNDGSSVDGPFSFQNVVVDVEGLDKDGKKIEFRCGGLLSRAIQHETDHLNGILFIDRMDKATKEELRPELERLQAETKARLKK
jgi:peptide deformylase